MRFDDIRIGHHGVLVTSGVEIRVCAIDEDDPQIMDEVGAWHDFDQVDFPTYAY